LVAADSSSSRAGIADVIITSILGRQAGDAERNGSGISDLGFNLAGMLHLTPRSERDSLVFPSDMMGARDLRSNVGHEDATGGIFSDTSPGYTLCSLDRLVGVAPHQWTPHRQRDKDR
jgi:hypothetical protein